MKITLKLLLICLLFTSCFAKKQNELKIDKDEKLTLIFDFDATMYNFNKDSAYFDQIYYSIVNGDEQKMKEYKIGTKEIAAKYKEHDFVKELANKYYKNISQKDIDFAVDKVSKNQTPELGNIIKKLKQDGHKVMIIGGSAFGCSIIPDFAKQFGIEKSDIYSGYFKDFSKQSLQTAFKFDTVNFEYVNCANPDIHTIYSKKKSDLIKLLKKEGKIKGKIIHIGDGESDLEVWQAKEADLFIGFGVNRYSKKVEDGSEIYVKTMDGFKNEIDKILNQHQKQHSLIIYPGRFQPFHQGHYDMIHEAQKHGKHVVIAISQAKGMIKDDRNVFSGNEREKMISDTLEKDGFKNYSIIQLDYIGVDTKKHKNKEDGLKDWDNNLIKATKSEYRKIFKTEPTKEDIAFIYYNRDKANYEKRFEKDFDIIEVQSSFHGDISATKIRKEFFEECRIDQKLPSGTKDFLKHKSQKIQH